MAQPQQGVEQPQELEWNEKKGESRDNAQSNPHASDAQAGFAGSSASAVNPAVATQDRGTIGHMSVPASSAQKGAHSMPVVPPMMGVLMGPGAAAPPANAPPLTQSQRATMNSFWAQIAHDTASVHVRDQLHAINLPLARIKKIMKSDDDVRMISSEAPTLFAKACEIFILELTLRAWIHSDENKRRTLQRSDIAAAISRTDLFDFLIDLVPANELRQGASPGASASISPHVASNLALQSDPQTHHHQQLLQQQESQYWRHSVLDQQHRMPIEHENADVG